MSHTTQRTTASLRSVSAGLTLSGVLAAGLAAAPALAAAQDPSARDGRASLGERFELRPFAGAYFPTGGQRDVLRDAFLLGAQASYRVGPQFAVTGSFAWAPSKDPTSRGDRGVELFGYDVGVEGRAASWRRGATWEFTPFAGLGVGGRTYHVRDGDTPSKFVGYGALGGEVGFGRFGVRVEGRDYLSGAAPLGNRVESGTRNDITVAAALSIRF